MLWDSMGRRQLLRVLQLTTAHEVARRCRVHKSQVSRWASGMQRPQDEFALKVLATVYGIDALAWRQPVHQASTALKLRAN